MAIWRLLPHLLFLWGSRFTATTTTRRFSLKALCLLPPAKEAADASGEGLPTTLDMPEMDLQDISGRGCRIG
jgi:hypothetical protein